MKISTAIIWILLPAIIMVGALNAAELPNEPIQAEVESLDFITEVNSLSDVDPTKTIEYLSKLNRLTGSYESNLAADHIVEVFQKIGLENVQEQQFNVPVPTERSATINVNNIVYQINSMWPNHTRAPKTLSEGLPGHLIYAADGSPDKLNGLDIGGAVALVDFNSSVRWLNVAQFGAAAIIFIEPTTTDRREAEEKFLQIPASIPRYYIRRAELAKMLTNVLDREISTADLASALPEVNNIGKIETNVRADVLWENRPARNIIGTIVGSDPALALETIVIESFYDSTSVVPSISPGADSTIGIATLIEAAKYFQANPPKRTVRFLATSGHFQALAGMRHWIREQMVWSTLIGQGGESTQFAMNNSLFMPPPSVWPSESVRQSLEDGEPNIWRPNDHRTLYVSLNLSTRSNQLGVFFKGHFYDIGGNTDEIRYRRRFSEIGRLLLEASPQIVSDTDIATDLVSCIDPLRGRDWRSYIPGMVALNNEVALQYGRPAIGIATVNDSRPLVDTPLDTIDSVDLTTARDMSKLLTGLMERLANNVMEIPEVAPNEAVEGYTSLSEDSLIKFLPGSPIAEGLLAVELNRQKSMMGVRGSVYAVADTEGRVLVTGLRRQAAQYAAFKIDRRDGSIEFVSRAGATQGRHPIINGPNWRQNRNLDWTTQLYEASATLIFDLLDQLNYRSLAECLILDAESDSTPRNSTAFLGRPLPGSSYSEPAAVVFTEREDKRLKVIVSPGMIGARFVLINATGNERADQAHGIGFPADQRENVIPMTVYQSASDLWNLNEFRLRQLEDSGVRNERASHLHQLSRARLDSAEKHLAEKNYGAFLRDARDSWAYGARAYPNVRGAADDVIKALIFYLAVLLPFAVFAERLIFAFADIRERLMGIAGLFASIYVILSLVHPGFKLSGTPFIILAGFFMLVLGLVTIFIVLGKFNTQMAQLREKSGVMHRADVARGAAAGAAFMLGISNLRRRKTRTILTSLTIVLLTFTVLSFTSFETSVAPNEIRTDYDITYRGILIRNRDWSPFEAHATASLEQQWQNATITTRTWWSATNAEEYFQFDVTRRGVDRTIVAGTDAESSSVTARGMAGFDPEEKGITIKPKHIAYGSWFDRTHPEYPDICILPEAMATRLGITAANLSDARVSIMGSTLRVIGVMNDTAFANLHDLDNEILTPVDYEMQASRADGRGEKQSFEVSATGEIRTRPDEQPPEQYSHINPSDVVIAPNSFVRKFQSATIRSLAVSLEGFSDDEIRLMLREYVPRSRLILFTGFGDPEDGAKVTLFSSRDALTAKGMQALFLPIAIAALIVFNTMLGSVYERLREIAVYTSCGLAPVHVASLFFAESSVFATLGAVIGYLFGQGVAKIVTWTGALGGINLNYSSVSAVYTILLVVVVVLLSTAYPARKAVQISVPDETKKMKLPKPTGDIWIFDFPFTVSQYEALGLNVFIRDYFRSHDEDSGDVFCADSVTLTCKETDRGVEYILDSNVWVEPLDMGISQQVLLETKPPADDDRVCTIHFTIRRLSGEVETWQRMNLGFLKAIRKQMLIWRLVDHEHKMNYDQQGKELLGKSVEV